MPSDFCGYLSDAAERLQVWHAALRERQFGLVRWAGDRVNKGPNAAVYVPAQGQSTQLFNDGSALAGLSGTPYRLGGSDAAAYEPLSLAGIVAMITTEGPAALAHIGGAFALAVSFPQRGELLLAIDRFAVENLFYVADADGVAYATRTQNLAGHPAVDHRFSPQAIYDYLYFHCIPGPETGFIGMDRLLPGHYLHHVNGRNTVQAYWEPTYSEDTRTPAAQLARRLPAIIEAAIARRQAPGRTACFLSGGLDSSTVTGLCAKRRPGEVTAFTIGFDASGYDEMDFARSVATHFNVEHAHYYVTPQDIVSALPSIIGALDGPFGNASAVPTYFCARQAAEHGFTSIMAGDGGDELFGGNSRYTTQRLFDHYHRLPGALRHGVMEPIAAALPDWARKGPLGKAASYVRQAAVPLPDRLMTYNLLNWIAPETFLTADFMAQVDQQHPVERLREMYQFAPGTGMINQLLHLDWRLTLADSDLPKVCRMTALAGIDVQYPMLDEAVFDYAASLPGSAKVTSRTLRPLYREAFKNFLPQSTLTKSKQGFGLPFGVWLQENLALKEFASAHLATLETAGLLKPGFRDSFLSGTLNAHPAYFGVLVWILMALGIWYEASEVKL